MQSACASPVPRRWYWQASCWSTGDEVRIAPRRATHRVGWGRMGSDGAGSGRPQSQFVPSRRASSTYSPTGTSSARRPRSKPIASKSTWSRSIDRVLRNTLRRCEKAAVTTSPSTVMSNAGYGERSRPSSWRGHGIMRTTAESTFAGVNGKPFAVTALQPRDEVAVKLHHMHLRKALQQRLRQRAEARADLDQHVSELRVDGVDDAVDDAVVNQEVLTESLAGHMAL